MSAFFSNAQNPSISGGIFSHVQGDQHNYYTGRARTKMITSSSPGQHIAAAQETDSAMTTTMVVHVNGNQVNQIIQQEGEHTEFDDYRNVKSGDFCRLEDVCVVEYRRGPWPYRSPPTANKTICAVKVIGTEGRFTSVTYSGPDARRAFEEDFRKCSRVRLSTTAQIFAVDVGTVPSLLLWHGLVPISHFKRSLGCLGGIYLYNLRRKLNCEEEELWVDSAQGVICQGPEGPRSNIGWMLVEVEAEKLPLTAEMLQEDVSMRFLASLKSKEVDRAFLMAMRWDITDDEDVPESCDQPTIFSTLTKTPIAVANNIWTSGWGFTERKALENGLTRFRLEADGSRLWLQLNWETGLAWLSQSLNIFQSCGISCDDDLSVYNVVYSRAMLHGDLDPSPSKSHRRRQQPIYLFVYLPLPDLSEGKTSRLHFWSFHKHGQHRLSPESCLDFGLPIELKFLHRYDFSRVFNNYKVIHQYQLLRGFDPATTDFAQHLGYDAYVFQPIHHSNRFMEVDQEHSDSLDGSGTSDSSECLSDMMDQQLAEDPTSMTSNQGQITSREDGPTINSDRIANKRQKRMGYEAIARNDSEPDLRHKNDATNGHDPAMDGHNSRLVQPLPTRFRPFPHLVNSHPPIPLNYCHPPQVHQSQLHPPYYHNNRPPYPYPFRPAYPSSGDVPFASHGVNMAFPTTSDLSSTHLQSQGWPESSQNLAAPTHFNASPPFHAYNSAEIANTASNLTRSPMDLDHDAPGAYSGAVVNAPRYDLGVTQNIGWSGTSQVETSGPVNMFYNGPAYPATSYSTPAVTHPSNPAYSVNFTYSPHGATPTSLAHDPGYPSPFPFHGGGSFAPQQQWNPPVAHHDPSYNLSSFSSLGASYLSNSTVHTQTHLSFPAHTPQGHPSMFPSNGGDPLVPLEPWNTPGNHPQQYTCEPSMRSTQSSPWNQTSGEYGQGHGS
ncbi:hypothetical protein PQX77_001669 [Marasmius sp. AFHP31]|nr:hypothetical protein PQX77_001669 [Marasmius sp. AFHP31]